MEQPLSSETIKEKAQEKIKFVRWDRLKEFCEGIGEDGDTRGKVNIFDEELYSVKEFKRYQNFNDTIQQMTENERKAPKNQQMTEDERNALRMPLKYDRTLHQKKKLKKMLGM